MTIEKVIGNVLLILVLILPGKDVAFCSVYLPRLQQFQENINQAITNVRPSVISVKAKKKRLSEAGGQFLWYESIGSGLIVDERGYIVTNYHVVEGSENITITLWRAAKNEFSAEVVDTDKSSDLALVKVNSDNSFIPVPLDNSNYLKTGDWVICVGSPFGFQHTVTFGIVSDLHREMMINGIAYKDMIQTDAVINEGNSGGPLINILGRVVGVGTAIYAPDGTYAGIGFAIPINRVKHFYSRSTGAVLAAATSPIPEAIVPVVEKEAIDLNNKMPRDQVHQQFSDCLKCHSISKKRVVSLKTSMNHPPVGACDNCHILVNDKVAGGPVTVAAVKELPAKYYHDMPFKELLYLIVMKLAFLTLVASIIFTMMGVGGGFAYVPILLACGIDFQTAAATSLIMLLAAQFSSLYNFFKSRLVDLKMALVLEIPTMIGAFFGGIYSNSVELIILNILFSGTVFFATFFMLKDEGQLEGYRKYFAWSKGNWKHVFNGHVIQINVIFSTILTLIVGYMGGLLGVAGGWLKVPMMVVLFNAPLKIAIGTSSLMVPITALTGFIGHSISGHLDLRLAFTLSIFTIIGAQIGSRIAIRIEKNLLRFIFSFVLFAVGVWMIIRII